MQGIKSVDIVLDEITLKGDLHMGDLAKGIIVFAHGSGSSRFSPRNRQVAERLHGDGQSTLLMDLLTEKEEKLDMMTASYRFNIPLLAERVQKVLGWVNSGKEISLLPVGLFGSSTGAAAAIIAAANMPDSVRAVVSRGGRVDLAEGYLNKLKAATMLIVGELDYVVLDINRRAFELIKTEKSLEVLSGATHLFEEPGALEKVADLAAEWFNSHLKSG
jgi:putative phosphoribosyl transferase